MSETEIEPGAEPVEAPDAPETPEEPEEAPEAPETPAEPQEAAPPAAHGMTEAELEAAFKAIDRSFGTYKAAVERNLQENALDLLACPLCFGTAHPAYLNKHDAGHVPDEVQEAVLLFMGLAREGEYEQDKQVGPCPNCGGRGKTKTGSLVGEHMARTCPTCKGYGYVPPPGATAAANGAPPEGLTIEPPPAAELGRAARPP
jgi:hypothetical protein